MKLQFLSPGKTIYDGDVQSVTIPGTKGMFSVWEKHAPLITTMTEGTVVFRITDKEIHEVHISGGFAEVKDNVVTICVEKIIEKESAE